MNRWLSVALALVFGAGCGSSGSNSAGPLPGDGLRVASFDFAESALLAELYAQVLEADGVPVVRLGAVGPREVVAPALELDRIDLVPEYLGTASAHFGAATSDLAGLTSAISSRGLVALAPSAAQDVNVVVVTEDIADAHGLVRISDLAEIAEVSTFGGPVECSERPLCLLGLRDTYGLEFAEFVPQRTLAVTAEALLQGEIDVGVMFSTAAELTDRRLVTLEDDRGLQPAENVVPVIRASALDRWGLAGRDPLARLSTALTTEELRVMNERVEDGEALDAVARSWLSMTGAVAT